MGNSNNLSAVSSNLLTAKMLQSKLDGRLAYFKGFDGDRIILEMDRIGERRFSIETVNKGFGYILDNETLIKCYFFNKFSPSALFNEQGIYQTASVIYDELENRFPDVTNFDIYQILKNIIDEVNKKSGL